MKLSELVGAKIVRVDKSTCDYGSSYPYINLHFDNGKTLAVSWDAIHEVDSQHRYVNIADLDYEPDKNKA